MEENNRVKRGKRFVIIGGISLVASIALNLALEAYYLQTRPSVMQPDEGRVFVLNVNGNIAYLTSWEHILVESSFWLTFGLVVVALICKTLFGANANGKKTG